MLQIKDKNKCTGCTACMFSCFQNCIDMKQDEEGFLYPNINLSKCIDCRKCEEVCPVLEENKLINKNTLTVYAAINKKEDIRQESSSGGVFSIVAEYVISQGGVVFGAAFSDNCHSVHHIGVESKDDIKKLRGSNYLQSSMDDCYIKVKENLKKNRLVLFTGTPCQIGGLKKFLGKEYENLILQDIVCHGVASPLVWDYYLSDVEEKHKSKIKRVTFRKKEPGWKKYSLSFEFENNEKYNELYSRNLYFRGFVKNLYLRPSCYNCSFKGITRYSDITLADFWGVDDILPEFDDDKGTSMVFINSPKGSMLFEKIKASVLYKDIDINSVLKFNRSIVDSAKKNKKREVFMNNINQKQIEKLLKKYNQTSFVKKVMKKIKIEIMKGVVNNSES